jgi:cytidylate kinase
LHREKITAPICHFIDCSFAGFLRFPSAQEAQETKAWKADTLSAKRLLMNLRKIVIAIDGYSACGKSSTAKAVSAILGYRYIDTGAMYRAVTLFFLEQHVALTNPKEVSRALNRLQISFKVNSLQKTETYLNGLNVEHAIRSMDVSEWVSQVSAIKDVRTAMVEQQRRMGRERGVVMDGRDIGTVVFPHADLKIFMNADLLVRSFRRQRELLDRGQLVDLDDIVENIIRRDKADTTRTESPLRQATDAHFLDTTFVTLEEQVDEVVRQAIGRIIQPH